MPVFVPISSVVTQRAPQIETFQQQRDGGDLIECLLGRLPSEHGPLSRRCPGREEVQAIAAIDNRLFQSPPMAAFIDELRLRWCETFQSPHAQGMAILQLSARSDGKVRTSGTET
jgi:hypothetical protein